MARRRRLFFDADVLVAASFSTAGAAYHILNLCAQELYTPIVSTQVLEEVRRNIQTKMPQRVEDAVRTFEAILAMLPHKEDAVVKLFEVGRISSGYAASLLGMTRRDFLEFLQKRGVP